MTDLADATKPSIDGISDRRRYQESGERSVLTKARESVRGVSQQRLAVIAMTVILGVGLLVRFAAAITLSPHVDEPSSVLAAHAVAERGLPILPSGTPYFQGVTLSYLLQPFIWLDLADIDNLQIMRMIPVVAGTITVYLCYRLGRYVTGDAQVGLAMAALVAIDPMSVQWSGHLRMYGLLQALVIALAWAFARLLNGAASWRQILLVAALYWASVFTHVGASLLGPAMALAALILYRRELWRQRRVLGALALSAFGPILLLTVNQLTATENEPVNQAAPFWSFVGDNLLAPFARFRVPTSEEWSGLAEGAVLFWMVPLLIVAASTIIGGRYLLRHPGVTKETRTSVIALLSLYWFPFLVIIAFTLSLKDRYLLHLHVLGYLFLAVLMVALLRQSTRLGETRRQHLVAIAQRGIILAVALAILSSLSWRLNNTVVQPDYNAAMAYVAENHQPGEPVIVTLPPVGYLTMDEPTRGDVVFLAGSEGFTRAERYTRISNEGRLIDYWIGADSIVSTGTLQQILESHPNAWVIADEGRLDGDWINEASIKEVLRDTTYPAYLTDGGAVVFRTLPAEESSDETEGTVPVDAEPGGRNGCQDAVGPTQCVR